MKKHIYKNETQTNIIHLSVIENPRISNKMYYSFAKYLVNRIPDVFVLYNIHFISF